MSNLSPLAPDASATTWLTETEKNLHGDGSGTGLCHWNELAVSFPVLIITGMDRNAHTDQLHILNDPDRKLLVPGTPPTDKLRDKHNKPL